MNLAKRDEDKLGAILDAFSRDYGQWKEKLYSRGMAGSGGASTGPLTTDEALRRRQLGGERDNLIQEYRDLINAQLTPDGGQKFRQYYDITSDDSDFYFDDYSDAEDYANCPSYTTVVDDIYALNLGSSGEAFYPDTALAQMAISNGDYGTWQMNHYIMWFGTRPAGDCGLVDHYQLVFSVPIMHIQAYYYYTNQYSKSNGKYEVLYQPLQSDWNNVRFLQYFLSAAPFRFLRPLRWR